MNIEILDRHLPPGMRADLETRFYADVNEAARIENTLHDPMLWAEETHVTWFSDHGVIHVRDVAVQVLRILDVIHGVMIPERPLRRFNPFMKTYGVLLAYLHDIGMVDFSAYGRGVHPEFAAHAVFDGALDPWVRNAWDENLGNIAWRLVGLERKGALDQNPYLVFQEMLSLSMAHSKSKVPSALLTDRRALRDLMLHTLTTPLPALYAARRCDPATQPASLMGGGPYRGRGDEAFAWLASEQVDVRELADDVIDTLRALRCADALRQRGTLQKTSAGYEVFVSRQTGNATFSVRQGDDKLYILEHPEPISAGEANIASSELTREGDLRISFHRGAFASEAAVRNAVRAAAVTVNGIQDDVIDSFTRSDAAFGGDPANRTHILLEAVDDNPSFVDQVIVALLVANPMLASRVERVPSLGAAAIHESLRYLASPALNWDRECRLGLLEQLSKSGQRTDATNLDTLFEHVRLATVGADERLIEAETPAGFVYVPLGEGFIVVPLGGYQSFAVKPFMPLGATGVIRGAIRNADVIAVRPVDVLIIPKEVYLQHWHRPYTLSELHRLLTGG